MKTYKFKFGKLVRDKIAGHVIKGNGIVSQKTLNEKDYLKELIKKLLEESAELGMVKKRDEIIDELGDVQEIIDSLLVALKCTKTDLKKIQAQKNKKNGSFTKRIYVNNIKVDENYAWLKYYLKNKLKYPQIK